MSATSRYYRPPTETRRTPTYEELFGTSKSAERIAYDKEQARLEEQARKERQESDRKRREAYFAEQEKIKSDTLVAEGKELVGSYRDQYSTEHLFELGAVNSFEIAKVVADETYKQYWYDKANDIIGNFTDEDYKLIAEPQYEEVEKTGRGPREQRRVLPKGYEELLKAQEYIEKGPLDFSSEETHKMLIEPPTTRTGYGKYQYWIDEEDPLRQAVEAQADVMTKYLDNEGISIVKDFKDGNPNNIYGEGVYLNTGTAAHIDWDSDLKRGQSYQSTPDAELGSYSQVFYRPEASSILDHWMVDIMAAITGTKDLLAVGRGGDLDDLLEANLIANVAPDFLESGLGQLGIDADLFGIDPNTFSDSINEVQTEMIKGKSGTDALVKEFGGAVVKNVGETVGDIAGGALGSIVDLADDVVDAIGDTALVGAIEEGGKYLLDKGQDVIDIGKNIGEAVVDTADDLIDTFGEEVVDPALKEGKKVAEAVVDKADDAIDAFGEKVVDPALQQGKEIGQDFIDKGKEIGEGIVNTVDNVVDKFGEEAVDPVLAKAKDLGQDLIDKGKEAGEFVVDTVDDALDYLGEEYIDPALQALKDIELPEGPDLDFPDIDFPDINLPDLDIDLPKVDIDLPDLDLPDLPDIDLPDLDLKLPELSFDPKLLAGLMPQEQQPTEVEGLFDKELFKFDTEIKSTQEMLSPFMNLRRYG